VLEVVQAVLVGAKTKPTGVRCWVISMIVEISNDRCRSR
jgi:hypothetical protein